MKRIKLDLTKTISESTRASASSSLAQAAYRSSRLNHPRLSLPWSIQSGSHHPNCPLWQQQSRARAAMPLEDPFIPSKPRSSTPAKSQRSVTKTGKVRKEKVEQKEDPSPRNPVGVQLLSPSLRSQIFPPSTSNSPPPDPLSLSLSLSHLSTHSLSPSQASVLNPISFQLPPLQGSNLSEHFWNLGRQVAQPWLGMAHELSKIKIIDHPDGVHSEIANDAEADADGIGQEEWLALPPNLRKEIPHKSSKWRIKPGWTRYPILRDSPSSSATSTDQESSLDSVLGDGYPVEFPLHEDGALSFDVETMPKLSPYPVMATAIGKNAWYSWLSPWLLNEGEGKERTDHLIPFGSNSALKTSSDLSEDSPTQPPARLLIGHNVSFDRARILDEYSLDRSQIRFLDTMSLHVATRGISSPQRPAWVNHSKARALKKAEKILKQEEIREETKRALRSILGLPNLDEDGSDPIDNQEEIDEELLRELDLDLNALGIGNEDDLPKGASSGNITNSEGELDHESASTLWQDVTSSNSLADVANLHCGISISKEERNLFVEAADRSLILDNLPSLLNYCARDSDITLKVFQKVFPSFIQSCPNPTTLAGVLGLGSAILPIDQEWELYRKRSEEKYESSRLGVSKSLVELAENLREQGMKGLSWEYLQWYHQKKEALLGELRSEMEEKEKKMKPTKEVKSKVKRNESTVNGADAEGRVFESPWWESDPWASQLDWTPKRPKRLKIPVPNSSDQESSTSSSVIQLLPLLPGHRRVPKWYRDALKGKNGLSPRSNALAVILKLQYDGKLIRKDEEGNWIASSDDSEDSIDLGGSPLRKAFLKSESKKNEGIISSSPDSPSKAQEVLQAIIDGDEEARVRELLSECAEEVVNAWEERGYTEVEDGLDWKLVEVKDERLSHRSEADIDSAESGQEKRKEPEWWPKWYWDLFDPKTGNLDLTIRTRISPILLKISWRGNPLFHSREHGWTYRELPSLKNETSSKSNGSKPLTFKNSADVALHFDALNSLPAPSYFKVPHPSGDKSNVGSPFSKSFLSLFENEVLQSQQDDKGKAAAKNALEMNAQCSYWIGVRDRVAQQMVVWNGEAGTEMGFSATSQSGFPTESGDGNSPESDLAKDKKGLILPQVVSMGTVTRRAIEKTWLTASNAKKNRVGSELKAMVKAPAGWNIVGADVDSEELWICSVMGDAQFGFHGATAVGWMTLEGTKSLGTDLHSKTASILGTSRNQAKVFNYSRIYGAGINHAKQLLMKADPNMSEEEAMDRAKDLYSKTKGMSSPQSETFGNRRFWYGGTESYVFNKLEEIAISDQPKTPALDCGVTAALSRKYLPKKTWDDGRKSEDYMPSRINWVVQSSGVDYLHLLITSMEHLCKAYKINARFMLSVHDEVRYLCTEEDTDRTTLALQISNLWTRAMFSHKLQIDNLPQGCAFFALVDTDKVLRKEVDDPCVTPSHPDPIPPGLALDIEQTLKRTNHGSLHPDGRPMETSEVLPKPIRLIPNQVLDPTSPDFPPYSPSDQQHRSIGKKGLYFLQAQAASDSHEIRALERRARELEGRNEFGSRIEGENFGRKRTSTSTPAKKSSARSISNRGSQSGSFPSQSRSFSSLISKVGPFAAQFRCSSTSAQAKSSKESSSSSSESRDASTSEESLPPPLSKLLSHLPPKPDFARRTVHRSPFFKKPDHRMQIRWGLYRSLLRCCDTLKGRYSGNSSPVSDERSQDAMVLKGWIKIKFRVYSKTTQKSLLLNRIAQGNQLLHVMERAISKDEESQAYLSDLVCKILDKRYRRRWENSIDRFLESEKPIEISYPSGALLGASHSNPPLPRFKPTQPIEMSMTIFRRRVARMKRFVRQAELLEIKNDVIKEAQFEHNLQMERTKQGSTQSNVKTSFKGDIENWVKPANEQLQIIRAAYKRDEARSKMSFDVKTLLQAKDARRKKHRWRLAQKIKRQGGLIDESEIQSES